MRGLARDVVDARRGIGEWYMLMVVVLHRAAVPAGPATKIIADVVVLMLLLVIVGEGWLVGREGQAAGRRAFPWPEHPGRHDLYGHARHQHAPDADP